MSGPIVGQLPVLGYCRKCCVKRTRALRQACTDQTCQHIACTANGQATVAGGVDARSLTWRGNNAA